MSKLIPIYFTFNDNYVVPAAVAFYSLLQKAKEDVFYDMFVLHADISEQNQKLLLDIINKFQNSKLTFINTGNFLKDAWNNGNFEGHNFRNQFTSDTIVKCFGSKFFPQYKKIIYSDVDVIFSDDISELYDIDLGENYIGAVKGAFLEAFSKSELSHLSLEHFEKLKDSYFAGGIWLLNLEQIRKDNLEKKMLDIIGDNSIIKRWPDQDIMNIACDNKVKNISLNYISYPYMIDIIEKPGMTSHYTKEELYDSILNPKIIHFAGLKPWKDNPNYSNLWWSYFNYLNLPKTNIFKEYEDENYKRLRKKIQKYKNLFYILLTTSVILFITSVYFLIY